MEENMRQLTNLSFSQINQFETCPKQWYISKVLGESIPQTSAASRGQQFDQLLAHSLGLVNLEDCDELFDKAKGQPIPHADERLQEAVDTYLASGGWDKADETQKEVRLSPEQWDTLAGMYDVDYPLPLPIVGYIDLFRRDSTGLRTELVDVKTSDRAEYRPSWGLQCALYCLIERSWRFEVHLITFTKQIRLCRYAYHPTKTTFQWAMNRIGYTAQQMMKVAQIKSADAVPAVPGYSCGWCPRQTNCEAAVVGKLTSNGGSNE
jgi:CRISPR/Cas system-associated exonuclease Cas4 (RecB family)